MDASFAGSQFGQSYDSYDGAQYQVSISEGNISSCKPVREIAFKDP